MVDTFFQRWWCANAATDIAEHTDFNMKYAWNIVPYSFPNWCLGKNFKNSKSWGMETYAPMQFHAEDKNRKPISFFAFLHQQASLYSTLQKKKKKKRRRWTLSAWALCKQILLVHDEIPYSGITSWKDCLKTNVQHETIVSPHVLRFSWFFICNELKYEKILQVPYAKISFSKIDYFTQQNQRNRQHIHEMTFKERILH